MMHARLTLLLIALLLAGAGGPGHAQDYFIGPDQFDLPCGGVLGTDGYGPYVEVPVPTASDQDWLAWVGLTIEGGRYRASWLIRTEPFGASQATLYSDIGFSGHTCIREVTGPDLPRDGSVYPLSVEIAGPSLQMLAGIRYRGNEGGELETVRIYGLSFTRLDGGLALTKVRPRKLLYEPGEAGVVDVTVQNFTNHEMSGTLQLTLTQELDRADPQPTGPVMVPPGQAAEVALPFPGRTLQYGCQARVRVTQGEAVLDEVSDVFGVSDNVFRVGMGVGTGDLYMSGSSGYATAEKIALDVERCRETYTNWWEKMFWAPDDWGDLTPEAEEWISGQSARWENASRIREFIAALKPHGIKAVTYAQNSAKGPAGWERMRQHPEWFYANPQGTPSSWGFDAWDLAHWNDIALHTDPVGRLQFSADCWPLSPDLRQPVVLEWGLGELIASMQDFGWGGVRFDGHWTVGNDALSTANMQYLKQAMWEQDPDFLFGFNWGYSFGHQLSYTSTGPLPLFDHEFRESMAGGGMFVQEGINNWVYGPDAGESYQLWSEYAAAEEAAARGVHALGGSSYCFCYYLNLLNPIDQLYKFAIGTMCGAHPMYGGHILAPGCPNWGRFLTRWSSVVWDPELQPVAEGDVDVVSGGSLLWQNWGKQRVVDESSRQVIVHLLNPQLDDSIEVVDDLLPAPVSDVVVSVQIPVGQTLTHAVLLDPWQGDQATPLAITLEGGMAQVTVPRVEVWSIVVFEFSGSFALPPPREQFTEPPDPAEVEAGRLTPDPVVGGPLTPEELAGQRPWLYETDGINQGAANPGVADPEADNGMAQVRDSSESWAPFGRNWLGAFPPGRYAARMRIKLEDANTPPHSQWMGWAIFIYNPFSQTSWYLVTPDFGYPPEQTLIPDGVYHYYDIPIELQQATYISLSAGASVDDPAGTRLLLDHILVEQLEAYTDAVLDPSPPPPPPVEIGGAPGLDVLVVNGFTWDTYRLPEAWGADARVQELWWRDYEVMDDFPQSIEDLAPYDEVVLADTDVSSLSLEARRALRDYVAAGGGLLLLGGPYALGQGFISGTYVEDLLPVSVSPVRDLLPADTPLVLTAEPTALVGPFADSLLAQSPEVYWRHLIELRPEAEVHLRAGSEPVLVTGSYGEGRVTVFSGAALGSPASGHLAFWEWEDWPALLSDVVYWTGSIPEHTLSVSASASPSTVISGGTTSLSASATDSHGHGIALWSWDDAGAGGSFSPSAAVQNPIYNAPANTTDSDLVVTLTVTATCDGPSPLGDSDSTQLTVQPVEHTFEVYASADPSAVESGATTSLTGNYSDSRSAHTVASWSWDDGGAGGTFDPSADVQNPTYTAPANTTGVDLLVTLTVNATCDGPEPLSDSDSVNLTVEPAAPWGQPIPEVLLEVHPNERAPGSTTAQSIGGKAWTRPAHVPGAMYWWKHHRFVGSDALWIQVCAQNWNATQNGTGDDDNIRMRIDGFVPVDYDLIQNGPWGAYQWRGDKEHGHRWTLRFLYLGASPLPVLHALQFEADETPVIWWIKVTDLEPGVIEAE
jgi:uncharacterized membrane protein